MKTKKLLILLICIFLSIQYGCDSVGKRTMMAEKFLISSIDSSSNHLLEFLNFKKIEGLEKQEDGVSYYILTFTGFVAAKKDCYWDGYVYKHNLLFPNQVGVKSMNVTESPDNIKIGDRTGEYTLFKNGLGYHFKGAIVFAKMESGWTVVDADVNFDPTPDTKAAVQKEKNLESNIEKPLASNIEKLAIIKHQVDSVNEKSKYRHVYLKFYGKEKPLKINNLQWPENLDEAESTINIVHNKQNRVIAFVQMPFSHGGDWSMTIIHYFDENGNTICIKKETSEFNGDEDTTLYKAGKVYFYTNERVFDNGFNTISVTNEITDAKDKKIKDPNFNFTTFMSEFPDFRNSTSILQSFRIT